MNRLWGCAAVAVVMAVSVGASASGATNGVPRGTAVTVRANPDNAIVTATRTAAARVGLGHVEAVGFHPDCAPSTGRVVVCRDPQLGKKGVRAVALRGSGWCVVHTDPRVGGAEHGVNVMTRALNRCLSS